MTQTTRTSDIAVVENVMVRSDFQYVWVGDLLFCDESLTYIPYSGFRCSTPIVSGAAAVMGGLVGAVANRLLEGPSRMPVGA